MIQRLVFNSIVIAVAIIATVGIIVTVYLMNPEKGSELVLNLIAESIGIIMTVLVIDVLIKWNSDLTTRRWEQREEQRRLPAKCLLYARLLEITDDFLVAVLPPELRAISAKRFRYGDIEATPMIEPLKNEVLSRLSARIERDFESRRSFDDTPVSQAKQQLDAILGNSAFLLDPEPMSLLLKLERNLKSLSLALNDVDWAEQHSRQEFALLLSEAISATVKVRTWLEYVLDRHFTVMSP